MDLKLIVISTPTCPACLRYNFLLKERIDSFLDLQGISQIYITVTHPDMLIPYHQDLPKYFKWAPMFIIIQNNKFNKNIPLIITTKNIFNAVYDQNGDLTVIEGSKMDYKTITDWILDFRKNELDKERITFIKDDKTSIQLNKIQTRNISSDRLQTSYRKHR